MSPQRAAATILQNMVLRPSLLRLLAAGTEPEKVVEITIASREIEGQTLATLALRGCVVVAIRRGDKLIAPTGSTTLQFGDVLTLLGGKTAIDAAQEKFIRSSLSRIFRDDFLS